MSFSDNTIALISTDKPDVFAEVEKYLEHLGLKVIEKDDSRPWGGFFKINESQTKDFIKLFFADQHLDKMQRGHKLSPKVLIVAPEKRLSWQYHHRRAEVWKVISGEVEVVTSMTDKEVNTAKLALGNTIFLDKGERHRIVGQSGWGLVAEIWQHIDKDNPSDEYDIIRLQDDFGR